MTSVNEESLQRANAFLAAVAARATVGELVYLLGSLSAQDQHHPARAGGVGIHNATAGE